ncbi:hypothetical protein [Candidatus Solincola sp.]|jgi:hypothetical protein|nr:hypothetical protein [Actinomycetota bacterium]MDI7251031.1 hypothetical protein [Actinomycetota bacterium]
MNRFYLAVRIVVLVALFFLLAAVFWGIANRDKTVAHGNEQIALEYRRTKPATYTSYLLIAFVVGGIFVVLGSIIYDYHHLRRESMEEEWARPGRAESRPEPDSGDRFLPGPT